MTRPRDAPEPSLFPGPLPRIERPDVRKSLARPRLSEGMKAWAAECRRKREGRSKPPPEVNGVTG